MSNIEQLKEMKKFICGRLLKSTKPEDLNEKVLKDVLEYIEDDKKGLPEEGTNIEQSKDRIKDSILASEDSNYIYNFVRNEKCSNYNYAILEEAIEESKKSFK